MSYFRVAFEFVFLLLTKQEILLPMNCTAGYWWVWWAVWGGWKASNQGNFIESGPFQGTWNSTSESEKHVVKDSELPILHPAKFMQWKQMASYIVLGSINIKFLIHVFFSLETALLQSKRI